MSEESTLHEDLAESLKELETADVTETPEAKPEEPAAPVEPAAAVPETKVDEPPTPTDPVTLSQDKPPSGWTPKMRERWMELSPEFRAEIIRREQASADGVRGVHEKYREHDTLINSVARFNDYMDSIGISKETRGLAVANVMETERALRLSPPQQKLQLICNLAEDYGLVGFRDMVYKALGHEKAPAPPPQVPQELVNELNEMRAWRARHEEGAVQREMQDFAATHEYFEDVREAMADIMEGSKREMTLDEAYEKAVWMVPEIREVMLARKNGQAQREALANRQSAAGKASPSPNGELAPPPAESDDLRDIVTAAVRGAL